MKEKIYIKNKLIQNQVGLRGGVYRRDSECGMKITRLLWSCLLVLFLGPVISSAQTSVTLDQAIDLAIKNNLSLNNERLKTEEAKSLIKSATDLPATDVITDWGQINSKFFDTKFGVSQTLAFPAVYARHKQVFTEEWKAAVLSVTMKEAELRRTVKETYYTWLYWKEKEKLLVGLDTLYANLLEKATLRLQKGESNVLEKTTFQAQKNVVEVQLTQVRQELVISSHLFELLLNAKSPVIPAVTRLRFEEEFPLEQFRAGDHPMLKWISRQQDIAKARTKQEKSGLLPSLMLGYNNSSMRGMGANEIWYNSDTRFHTAQLGLGIPIFNTAKKARIKASRINEQVAVNQFNIEKEQLENKRSTAMLQYRQQKEMLTKYETEYLKNATLIQSTADRQFFAGEINYLEYVQLINQAITIQSGYLDLLHQLNQNLIHLDYLNSHS